MSELRVGLVTAFPPSQGRLAEYGWHLAHALGDAEGISRVIVFADRQRGAVPGFAGCVEVVPAWTFGSPLLGPSILDALRRRPVDVLWFNIHMTSTGNNRWAWFGGLCAPALARAAGYRVIVTLHNMLGLTDLRASGVRARPWDVAAAHLATRMLGFANLVSVLRPEYLELLKSRYGLRNVVHLPHGTLGEPAVAPPAPDGRHVLAFGRFGTYKRLEPLIEAVRQLTADGVPVRLSIGGSDSRHAPGYLSRVRQQCAAMPNVTILGYVPEAEVPALFRSAAVCVLPYETMTGMSGVAMQAATHGVPIVASDIPVFRALEHEGLRARFFDMRDVPSLTMALRALLESPASRERIARENLAYAATQRMSMVARGYVSLMRAVCDAPAGRGDRFVMPGVPGSPPDALGSDKLRTRV